MPYLKFFLQEDYYRFWHTKMENANLVAFFALFFTSFLYNSNIIFDQLLELQVLNTEIVKGRGFDEIGHL